MINLDTKNQYDKIDWLKLLRKDLGEYSLEKAKPQFDRIKSIFDDILNYPNIDNLSASFTNQAQSQLQSFVQFSNQIITDFKDTSQRQTWLDNVKNKEYEVFQNLSPIYNYIQAFDPSKDKKLKELVINSEERIKKLNEDLTKTEKLLSNAQKKATESEILEYGNFFGTEAGVNKKNAKINFWIMIGSIFLTVVLAIIFLQKVDFVTTEGASFWDNLLNTINTQNILIKFIILSLGGYLISHFSNVHSAEKHLYNLNIQRQNALNSHKQILDSIVSTESANEKEIRNAILLELTRAIFENKDTGYLKSSQNPASTSKIVEISKTLT